VSDDFGIPYTSKTSIVSNRTIIKWEETRCRWRGSAFYGVGEHNLRLHAQGGGTWGGRGCGGPSCLGSRLGGLVTLITGPLGGWQAIYQVGWITKAEIREMESDMEVWWLIGGSNKPKIGPLGKWIENMSGKPLKVGCSIHGFSDDLPMENRDFPMPSSINSKRIAIMISRSS
jgi:hypothetical protein